MSFTPLPILLKDGYKAGHYKQYPKHTTKVYSNLTARGSRWPWANGHIVFGTQAFVQRFLVEDFYNNFFNRSIDEVLKLYKRRMDNYLGPGAVGLEHIRALHYLGYLPLRIKSLPEGSFCPLRVPYFTVTNTRAEMYWLTNALETLLSTELWGPCTSATLSFQYRKNFEKYAKLTGGDPAFVPWQGHDFSMRGMWGVHAGMASGAAHLLSFTGTDTIPAIDWLEYYYGADCEKELIGGSVPATEHSVMCVGSGAEAADEFRFLLHLIEDVYPKGIVSVVSDTWDFWRVVTEYLPKLKDAILSRDGKLVIRPDSGDPVKILCGDWEAKTQHEQVGLIETLWNIFGGTYNDSDYRVLDPHIGAIYGDSITIERQQEILHRLYAKGFASTNVVLGIGSYSFQYVTRDTLGFAMKATYAEVGGEGRAIYKQPKTDSGLKNSAKGLLRVSLEDTDPGGPTYYLQENCTEQEERLGELQTVFEDGQVHNKTTLAEIRSRVESELRKG